MSPLPALARVALLASLALAARATRADDGAAAPSQAAATATAPGPRLRATHRVDVIGPGERVETVIDRLRAARPPHDGAASGRPDRAAPSVRPDSRADPRPDLRGDGRGDGRSEGGRPGSDDARPSPGSMGPLQPPAGGGRTERSGESEGERPHR
jgi:hypothetical protein